MGTIWILIPICMIGHCLNPAPSNAVFHSLADCRKALSPWERTHHQAGVKWTCGTPRSATGHG